MLIVGKAGTGKSTLAKALGFYELSFASELKMYVGWIRDSKIDDTIDYIESKLGRNIPIAEKWIIKSYLLMLQEKLLSDKSTKPRFAYQSLGQFLRSYDEDYFVKVVKKEVNDLPVDTPYVISDCRFKNEFEAFKNDFSIYLTCDDDIRLKRLNKRDNKCDKNLLNDISETELEALEDKCSICINTTNATMKDYKNMANIIKCLYYGGKIDWDAIDTRM